MENGNEIAVELSALSALVAGISRQTPYGVPDGYFDQLPANIMSRIASKSSTFQVPDGYFEGFAGSVLARIKASERIQEPTNRFQETDRFQVATEGVQEELARLSPAVSRIPRKTPYYLPEGYFGELSPLLTVAHNRPAYRVPAGYFGRLPELILERVAKSAAGAKLVRMEPANVSQAAIGQESARDEGGRVLKGNWWRYSISAAAAIAACFLLIFSLPGVDTSRESVLTAERGLEKLSDQDLQAYLDEQHAILAETVDQHPMLAETGAGSTATLNMNEGEVKSLLGGISDDDLQQYMEEHGKPEDFATN